PGAAVHALLPQVPAVAARLEEMRLKITKQADEARVKLDAERAAERATVQEWLRKLEEHRKAGAWKEIEKALATPPAMKYEPPAEMAPVVAKVRATLEQHKQLEADQNAARAIVAQMQSAASAENHQKVVDLHQGLAKIKHI